MSDRSVQLRITSVRSRGRSGGAIFAGVTEAGEPYVVVCDYRMLPDSTVVDKGQSWAVTGVTSTRTFELKGYRRHETLISAASAQLLRPSGRNLITWMAECPDCPGIGHVKAGRLYDRFGMALIDHIEQRNLAVLTEVVRDEVAQALCHAFEKHQIAKTLLFLDQVGIPRRIGASAVAFYQHQAQEKIEANPYILISFEANWVTVDHLAQHRLGVQEDDPRRLDAAIEEVLYRGLRRGHTCLSGKEVRAGLVKLLGSSALAQQALTAGENAQFRQVGEYYQPTGMYLIERYLAQRLEKMVIGADPAGQMELFVQIGQEGSGADAVIDAYERAHGLALAPAQREAVLTSARAQLSLILGGAGTGKTTVLKALYEVLNEWQPGIGIYQLALAGRAAQRMTEATGREAMTIAGFLAKVDPGLLEMGSVIVVDEVSMVDAILMYRLLRHLPAGVRLILVGDPSQLPPIGPGLVLHALAGLPSIPQTELKTVQRQSALSGIPQVAAAIRHHQEPVWAPYRGVPGDGVSFIACSAGTLEETVQRVYEELGGNGNDFSVQILSITNSNIGGVQNLNAALHQRYRQGAEPLSEYDAEFGVVRAATLDRVVLKVGDLVMYTENDYQLGLRNGSLGTVIKALPVVEADDPGCVCAFEGVEYELTTKRMRALRHSYSITVHKSQGSQFKRVVVPIRASRLLDQTLLYTAVTRGVDQVVLVGDEQAALRAIRAPASAARRQITLPMLLQGNP